MNNLHINASYGLPIPDGLTVEIPKELIPQFKQLINRALNTNIDCHPAFKEFGDMLEFGKPLQDYYAQRSDKPLKGTSTKG